jgi:RHS repeat-associated protein
VAKYLYDPYGNLISKSGPLADANAYRFASKECHANSGLIFFGKRFYDPNCQRWLNRDPIGEAGGANLYRYAKNSPHVNFDPWGTDNYYHIVLPEHSGWENADRWDDFETVWESPEDFLGGRDLPAGDEGNRYDGPSSEQSTVGAQQAATTGNSTVGNALRNIPLIGGILGGLADIVSGVVNTAVGAATLGFSGTLSTGLREIADGYGATLVGGFDVVGEAWASPNTAIGLALGTVGYIASWAGAPFSGKIPTISFDNGQIRFANDILEPLGDLTLGNVGMFESGYGPSDKMYGTSYTFGQHEGAHTPQGYLLGPFYLPAYAAGIIGAALHPTYGVVCLARRISWRPARTCQR